MTPVIALLLAAAVPVQEQAIEQKLAEIFEKADIPGISACVIMPDGREIIVTRGFADEGGKVPVTKESRFCGGSSGKMHFAVLAMNLLEKGVIKLDDPLSKYLGDEDWFNRLPVGKSATLRQFMNHTSGMREHVQTNEFTQTVTSDPLAKWRMHEVLSFVFDQEPHFAPGEGWSYADANYILMSLALEKITNKVAYEMIDGLTIKPLKLTQTEPSTKLEYANLANGQLYEGNPFGEGWALKNGRFKMNPQFEWAGGGYVTSPRDLARLTRAIVNAEVVSKESAKLMMQGVPARTGRNHQYGLGLMIRPSELGITYGHSGWYPGYVTDVQHFPEHGVTVAFQMNCDDFSALGMNYQTIVVELAKAAISS